MTRRLPTTVAVVLAAVVSIRGVQPESRAAVADRVTKLTRDSPWKLVSSVAVKFRTFHPQGMVKIGDTLFVSSVEVTVPTRRLSQPVGGYDRDTGEGVGHLFKMDLKRETSSPTSGSGRARSITRAGSITTARTSGFPWPSIVRTADRLSTGSTRRR